MDTREQDVSKVQEDLEAHPRSGLRTNDQNQHVDLDEDGAIQEQDRLNVWS